VTEPALALSSDDPARGDLLSFNAVAHRAADSQLDEALDPVTLGLSDSWEAAMDGDTQAHLRTVAAGLGHGK
jgi:hypothetical protein